jgi:hypothetical protein
MTLGAGEGAALGALSQLPQVDKTLLENKGNWRGTRPGGRWGSVQYIQPGAQLELSDPWRTCFDLRLLFPQPQGRIEPAVQDLIRQRLARRQPLLHHVVFKQNMGVEERATLYCLVYDHEDYRVILWTENKAKTPAYP